MFDTIQFSSKRLRSYLFLYCFFVVVACFVVVVVFAFLHFYLVQEFEPPYKIADK